MVPNKLRVIFAGQFAGGSRLLRTVLDAGHEVSLVLAVPKNDGPGTVAKMANARGIPVQSGAILRDPRFAERAADCDILLNVLSPFLVCDEVLSAPRIGSFNIHPSALPRYAGLAPTSFAIYHGESTHGVTLHWMASEMDAGSIVFQSLFPIDPKDTGITLLKKCFEAAVPIASQFLELAATNPEAIPRIGQDLSERSYFSRADYPTGKLLWGDRAQRLHGIVRAHSYWPYPSPWGEAQADLGGIPVSILAMARTGERSDTAAIGMVKASPDGVRVASADEWLLVQRILTGENLVIDGAAIGEFLSATRA
jgi:UDP-4-amino-4-deoxy-L-arabinose formyltransferase/UDP-glucuronic acid dehydrogenase (UDP-4-keto-hexauronic acid decarboxylating)